MSVRPSGTAMAVTHAAAVSSAPPRRSPMASTPAQAAPTRGVRAWPTSSPRPATRPRRRRPMEVGHRRGEREPAVALCHWSRQSSMDRNDPTRRPRVPIDQRPRRGLTAMQRHPWRTTKALLRPGHEQVQLPRLDSCALPPEGDTSTIVTGPIVARAMGPISRTGSIVPTVSRSGRPTPSRPPDGRQVRRTDGEVSACRRGPGSPRSAPIALSQYPTPCRTRQ